MFGDYNSFIEIFRETEKLYDGRNVTTTISPDPYEAAIIRATLSSEQSGSIALYGSALETLTFTSETYKETTSTFTSLTGMTVTSLTGDVTLETFNIAREPVKNIKEVAIAYGKYIPRTNSEYMRAMGKKDESVASLLLQPTVDIQTDDRIYIDSSTEYYIVKECVTIKGIYGNSHIEIILN